MIPGKRTARLIREAAVLGYALGRQHGPLKYDPVSGRPIDYPKDSAVLASVLRDARSFNDIYPALSKIEWEDTTKWPVRTTERGNTWESD